MTMCTLRSLRSHRTSQHGRNISRFLASTLLATVAALPSQHARRAVIGQAALASAAPVAQASEPQNPLGVSASVAVHDSERFTYAPANEMARCARCILGRCLDTRATVVVSFFPNEALSDVLRFYQAVPPLHLHVFEPTLFRAAASTSGEYTSVADGAFSPRSVDALGVRPGGGLMCGAHGLTVGYSLWSSRFTSESSDREHASLGIVGSTAGPLLAGSTDAPRPGPCVLHATSAPAMATALAAQLSDGEGGDSRIREALALGVIRKPLYALAAEITRVDRAYGGGGDA